MANTEEWLRCVRQPDFLRYFGEPGNRGNSGFGQEHLKTCPAGFPRDFEHLEYLRMKDYCCWVNVPDDYFEGDSWLDGMCEVFMAAKPMMDFVNAVIDDYE